MVDRDEFEAKIKAALPENTRIRSLEVREDGSAMLELERPLTPLAPPHVRAAVSCRGEIPPNLDPAMCAQAMSRELDPTEARALFPPRNRTDDVVERLEALERLHATDFEEPRMIDLPALLTHDEFDALRQWVRNHGASSLVLGMRCAAGPYEGPCWDLVGRRRHVRGYMYQRLGMFAGRELVLDPWT